tara:strand:+ start:7935 stop:8126 length:192 start_codon:yes stop_codon:yes gene_type:complete
MAKKDNRIFCEYCDKRIYKKGLISERIIAEDKLAEEYRDGYYCLNCVEIKNNRLTLAFQRDKV